MSDEKDLDAPRPPGGPQRGDAPGGGSTPDATPGTAATEPGPDVDRVSKRDDSHDIPPVTHDERDPSDADDEAVQLENAETSLDQPSS